MKKILALLATTLLVMAVSGCTTAQQSTSASSSSSSSQSSQAAAVEVVDCPVLKDNNFNSVCIDMSLDEFNALGFDFGDSVDVVFSNGYELRGIPYYNGYYVNVGDPLVVGYPGYSHVTIARNYGTLWDDSGLTEGDTATITLVEKGAYLDVQEALSITYTNNRSDYASDEVFANFRALSGGKLLPTIAYRSASPIDNEYGRAAYVEELMKQANVAYVLDLSDRGEEADAYIADSEQQGVDVSYFKNLRSAGLVGLLDLSASYPSQEFASKLSAGLVEMSQHEGPYLIHCVEGKDRTGFVCILLEALTGATYDEMQADYMETYTNYYGISKESDPDKYNAISNLYFDGMMSFLAGDNAGADLRSINYAEPARQYLMNGGMTSEQIDALVVRLQG